jgi:hypothetical protein
MSSPISACRSIRVVTFRGKRDATFAAAFLKLLADEKSGKAGPSDLDCLIHAGHTGVSLDGGTTILGFNPQRGSLPAWQMLDRLKHGDALPAFVRDDTAVFVAAATIYGLHILSFNVRLPDWAFQELQDKIDKELAKSRFTYGFPNGDGDCNCTTWLERLGLPSLTGRMDELVSLPGFSLYPSRRFGLCT